MEYEPRGTRPIVGDLIVCPNSGSEKYETPTRVEKIEGEWAYGENGCQYHLWAFDADYEGRLPDYVVERETAKVDAGENETNAAAPLLYGYTSREACQ
jgi:hypothetical protein